MMIVPRLWARTPPFGALAFQARIRRFTEALSLHTAIPSTTRSALARCHRLQRGRARQSVCTLAAASAPVSRTLSTASRSQKNDDGGPLRQLYSALVKNDEVKPDVYQLLALRHLERLWEELVRSPPGPLLDGDAAAGDDAEAHAASTSSFGSWFYSSIASASPLTKKQYSPIRGVYLHGGVGCGKTFLANLLYDSIQEGISGWKDECQKHHFHRFMLNVHQEMHRARYNGGSHHYSRVGGGGSSNPSRSSDTIVPAVVDKIVRQGRLVYLDEFQVTDVADALILQRLFTGLWERGAVVVATSNRPPDELYWNGIQRDRFLPFIGLLKQRCDVVSMWDSDTDYRLVQKRLGSNPTVYFVGKASRQDFDQLFYALASGSPVAPTSVTTQGRQVPVPQAVPRRGLARFSFEDLCQKALGAADYLQIGQTFHTVFVERVPVLSMNEINWVRRFITFIDAMYESKVKLILQATTAPNEILSRSPELGTVYDEFFAFDRTVSRLEEMQSERYLRQRWTGSRTVREDGPLKPRLELIDPSLGDSKPE